MSCKGDSCCGSCPTQCCCRPPHCYFQSWLINCCEISNYRCILKCKPDCFFFGHCGGSVKCEENICLQYVITVVSGGCLHEFYILRDECCQLYLREEKCETPPKFGCEKDLLLYYRDNPLPCADEESLCMYLKYPINMLRVKYLWDFRCCNPCNHPILGDFDAMSRLCGCLPGTYVVYDDPCNRACGGIVIGVQTSYCGKHYVEKIIIKQCAPCCYSVCTGPCGKPTPVFGCIESLLEHYRDCPVELSNPCRDPVFLWFPKGLFCC